MGGPTALPGQRHVKARTRARHGERTSACRGAARSVHAPRSWPIRRRAAPAGLGLLDDAASDLAGLLSAQGCLARSQLTVKLTSASSPATSAEATTSADSATSTKAARTKRTSAGLGTVPDWAAIGSSLNGDHGPQRPVTGASVHAREYLLPLGGVQVAPCLAHARTLIVAEIVPPVMNLLSLLRGERVPLLLERFLLLVSQPGEKILVIVVVVDPIISVEAGLRADARVPRAAGTTGQRRHPQCHQQTTPRPHAHRPGGRTWCTDPF
jgi:hypothetical protein